MKKINYRLNAIRADRDANFGLLNVIKRVVTSKEQNLKIYLSEIGVTRDQITIDNIKIGAGEEKFFNHFKNGERNGIKLLFNMTFILSALKNFSESQKVITLPKTQAKTQAKKVKKVA